MWDPCEGQDGVAGEERGRALEVSCCDPGEAVPERLWVWEGGPEFEKHVHPDGHVCVCKGSLCLDAVEGAAGLGHCSGHCGHQA